MNQVTINGNSVSNYCLGKVGEHNATELIITPSSTLTSNPDIASYRVYFKLRNIKQLYKTDAFDSVPITIPLTQTLTQNSYLSLQVIAFDGSGNYIGMDNKIDGFYFESSNYDVKADDISEEMQSEIEQLRAEIGNKVTKVTGKQLSTNDYSDDEKSKVETAYTDAHTHENKETVLDKFSLSKTGGLLFDGDSIGEGTIKDWDENDSASGKFIKNRTHYKYPTAEYIDENWDGSITGENHPEIIATFSNSKYINRKYFYADGNFSVYKITDNTDLNTVLTNRKYNITFNTTIEDNGKKYYANSTVVKDTYINWAKANAKSISDVCVEMGTTIEEFYGLTESQFAEYISSLEYTSADYTLVQGAVANIYGTKPDNNRNHYNNYMAYITVTADSVEIPNSTSIVDDNCTIILPQLSLTKGIYCVSSASNIYAVGSESEAMATASLSYAYNSAVKTLDYDYLPDKIKNDIDNVANREIIMRVAYSDATSSEIIGIYDNYDESELYYSDIYDYYTHGKSFSILRSINGVSVSRKYSCSVSVASSNYFTNSGLLICYYDVDSNNIYDKLSVGCIFIDSRYSSEDKESSYIQIIHDSKDINTDIDIHSYTTYNDIKNIVDGNKSYTYNGKPCFFVNKSTTDYSFNYLSQDGLYQAVFSSATSSWTTTKMQSFNSQADWSIIDETDGGYIRNKPDSISGYGISDAYTKTETDELINTAKLESTDVSIGYEIPTGNEKLWVKFDNSTLMSVGVGEVIELKNDSTDSNDDYKWICVTKDTDNNTVTMMRYVPYYDVSPATTSSWWYTNYATQVDSITKYWIPDDLKQYVKTYDDALLYDNVSSETAPWYSAIATAYGTTSTHDTYEAMFYGHKTNKCIMMLGALTDYNTGPAIRCNMVSATTADYIISKTLNYHGVGSYINALFHSVVTFDGTAYRSNIDKNVSTDVGYKWKNNVVDDWIDFSNRNITNDAGYLTEHQSLDGYATESYVQSYHDSTKADAFETATTIDSTTTTAIPNCTAVKEYVADKTLPTGTNTGDILVWNGAGWVSRRSRLPMQYQEVEYIGFTGTQYINTAVTNMRYKSYSMDITLDNQLADGATICATYRGWADTFLVYNESLSDFVAFNVSASSSAIVTIYDITPNVAYNIIASPDSISVNGTQYTIGHSGSILHSSYPFCIGGSTDTESYVNAKMQLRSFQIKDNNDVIIRQFVPCYNKVTGVIGMYDAVNGTFYTNAGTGTFTKGADV